MEKEGLLLLIKSLRLPRKMLCVQGEKKAPVACHNGKKSDWGINSSSAERYFMPWGKEGEKRKEGRNAVRRVIHVQGKHKEGEPTKLTPDQRGREGKHFRRSMTHPAPGGEKVPPTREKKRYL